MLPHAIGRAVIDELPDAAEGADTTEELGRPVTIRAVARLAGVSIATISRALKSPGQLKPATLEKVQSAIHRLGYTPNVQAQNLRTSQTRLIIALVPDIGNPFFSEVVRGIEKIAQQNDYSVLLGDTEYDAWREATYVKLIQSRQADGLITLLPSIPKLFLAGRAPIVNACECVDDPSVTTVSVDNLGGAKAATEYLLALGHREIALIRGRDGSPLSADREAGYREALRAAGVEPDDRLILQGDFSAESGIRAVGSLFAQGLRFTAIQCSNDEMAFGAISAIRQRGLSVPADISVIGFDDIRMARYFDPPLTTVAQPMSEIGMESARLLLEILAGRSPAPQKRVFPVNLVVRSSTGAPRSK